MFLPEVFLGVILLGLGVVLMVKASEGGRGLFKKRQSASVISASKKINPEAKKELKAKPRDEARFGRASITFGIISIVFAWIPILGIIFGILAVVFSSIQKKRKPTGIATAGFVTGIIGIFIGTISTIVGGALLTGII